MKLARGSAEAEDIRSLLSSKSLEDHLGIGIDAKVLDRLRVGGGTLSITTTLRGSGIAKGRNGVTTEGLHGEKEGNRKRSRQRRV